MIFGLPFSTFFLSIGVQLIAFVLALLYSLFFKDDGKWWTLDRLFEPKEQMEQKGGRHDE